MTADLAQELSFTGRFSVFDSFAGLSEFEAADLVGQEQLPPDVIDQKRNYYRSTIDHVRAVTAPYEFIDLYPGWIPERFEEVKNRQVSFAHIDVDLYAPTKRAIEFFYALMDRGGVMFFDDYGYKDFPGAKAAIDGLLEIIPPPQLFVALPVGSAFLVK